MTNRCHLPLVLALFASTLAAQPTKRLSVEATRHSFGMSWAMFAACDDNGDDRLDVFEAAAAFVGIDATAPGSFRKLDTDADGKLHWDEFDAQFRASLDSAKVFSVRTTRPIRVPIDPTNADAIESRASVIHRLADGNHDDRVSPRELLDFADAAELETAPAFAALDKDLSGHLTATELGALLPALPDGGDALVRRYQGDPKTLPRTYRAADQDRNGALDATELGDALVAIDPALRRWTDRILKDADHSGNSRLDRAEITRSVRDNEAVRSLALPTSELAGIELPGGETPTPNRAPEKSK